MGFDYSKIPRGFYDDVLRGPDGIRKFWHYHKFDSVLRFIPKEYQRNNKTILDFGCFAGSFLGHISEECFPRQLGIDILEEQISYAKETYQTSFRNFELYENALKNLEGLKKEFDVITLIEVIEHLHDSEIEELIMVLSELLKPNGIILITTPNYLSLWPVLEFFLNRFSDISYEEQHLTKFTYLNLESKLKRMVPSLKLSCQAITTSHFISPLVAGISYRTSLSMATTIPAALWKNPFGNIILSRWTIEN
jgi:2-polyprenyl-3-methyl-5-hydroxy-6-metoxy-1,4-benzoquinol methylase